MATATREKTRVTINDEQTMTEALSAEMADAAKTQTQATERVDPAPDPAIVVRTRMIELINSISDKGRTELADARDEIDNLISAIDTRNSEVIDLIEEHTRYVADVISAKVVIKEQVHALRQQFETPITITAPRPRLTGGGR